MLYNRGTKAQQKLNQPLLPQPRSRGNLPSSRNAKYPRTLVLISLYTQDLYFIVLQVIYNPWRQIDDKHQQNNISVETLANQERREDGGYKRNNTI
jgi:hypothetical protein